MLVARSDRGRALACGLPATLRRRNPATLTLSAFILENLESLIEDWTTFARSIPVARDLDVVSLRDHAGAMLRTIAADMLMRQSPHEQRRKSEGRAARLSAADTAAEQHGSARRQSGFELVQMAAEFRALRATVIRQWVQHARPETPESVLELVRFNEALDQAVAESLVRFVKEVDEARELFLGAIAHDMRGPISASIHAAHYLKGVSGLDASASGALDVVIRSHERLSVLTADILELMQLKLYQVPQFTLAPTHLEALCTSAIGALQIVHPRAAVTLQAQGDTHGDWDAPKLERVVVNLVENAIKHGGPDATVDVSLRGDGDEVEIAVSNAGEAIPADRLNRIFEPMTTWSHGTGDVSESLRNYGLGLFIAREIVRGHDGAITVESSRDEGTCFRVRLPRRAPTKGGPAPRGAAQHPGKPAVAQARGGPARKAAQRRCR